MKIRVGNLRHWHLTSSERVKTRRNRLNKANCSIRSCSDSVHCIISDDVACAAPTVQLFAAESNSGSTNNRMKIGISCTQAAGNYPAKSQLHDWKIEMLHGWKKIGSRNANEMQKKGADMLELVGAKWTGCGGTGWLNGQMKSKDVLSYGQENDLTLNIKVKTNEIITDSGKKCPLFSSEASR